ncbi:unnamed protein product, partial [Rotaria socialis]
MKIIFVYIVFFLILCIQADELDPLSDYLKGKILFAKIKSKTISTTTSTSHIVDDTFGDTLGEKIILAGIGSFVTATDSHNIFKHFTSKEYRQILDEIRHSILATDRALFFANHSKLAHIVDSSQFNWDNQRTY